MVKNGEFIGDIYGFGFLIGKRISFCGKNVFILFDNFSIHNSIALVLCHCALSADCRMLNTDQIRLNNFIWLCHTELDLHRKYSCP